MKPPLTMPGSTQPAGAPAGDAPAESMPPASESAGNSQAQQEARGGVQPVKPKVWTELTVEEKLERLRYVLHELDDSMSGTNRVVERNHAQFLQHRHDAPNQEVVIVTRPAGVMGHYAEGSSQPKPWQENPSALW